MTRLFLSTFGAMILLSAMVFVFAGGMNNDAYASTGVDTGLQLENGLVLDSGENCQVVTHPVLHPRTGETITAARAVCL